MTSDAPEARQPGTTAIGRAEPASEPVAPADPIAEAYRRACDWDVAVRKPGNVSVWSAGHRMQARAFVDSARVSAPSIAARGLGVGARILGAVEATWQAVDCNTNLGIVLLCAPIAAAVEQAGLPRAGSASGPGPAAARLSEPTLRSALVRTLRGLTRDDAAAAYRAIARAQPAGLGEAAEEDVRDAPRVDLRAAMALAADRDRIARQYRDDGVELFDVGLAAWRARVSTGGLPAPSPTGEDGAMATAVQHVYLAWLASGPDSHIVRKHGEAVAHSVMAEARAWQQRGVPGADDPEALDFASWDESLKTRGLNPGTSADLTVATLMLAALTDPDDRHD